MEKEQSSNVTQNFNSSFFDSSINNNKCCDVNVVVSEKNSFHEDQKLIQDDTKDNTSKLYAEEITDSTKYLLLNLSYKCTRQSKPLFKTPLFTSINDTCKDSNNENLINSSNCARNIIIQEESKTSRIPLKILIKQMLDEAFNKPSTAISVCRSNSELKVDYQSANTNNLKNIKHNITLCEDITIDDSTLASEVNSTKASTDPNCEVSSTTINENHSSDSSDESILNSSKLRNAKLITINEESTDFSSDVSQINCSGLYLNKLINLKHIKINNKLEEEKIENSLIHDSFHNNNNCSSYDANKKLNGTSPVFKVTHRNKNLKGQRCLDDWRSREKVVLKNISPKKVKPCTSALLSKHYTEKLQTIDKIKHRTIPRIIITSPNEN